MRSALDVAKLVRTELEKSGHVHSCIVASSVLLEAFNRNNILNALPLSVHVRAFNPIGAALVKKHGYDARGVPQAWRDAGCIAAGFGGTGTIPGPNQWDGHVMVMVPDFGFFDLTITQLNRYGMKIGPLAAQIPTHLAQPFLNGDIDFKAEIDGHLLIYKAFPRDKSFEKFLAWTDRDLTMRIADKIPNES